MSSSRSRLRLLSSLVVTSVTVLACSRSEGAVTTAHAEGENLTARTAAPPDVPLPRISASTPAYVGEAVTNGGTIAGTVELEGDAPADSTIVPPEEITRTCRGSFVDQTVARQGTHVNGVVVWLEGVRQGRPLPTERRYDVSLDDCLLTPRAQPVMVGGTVQIHSRSPLRTLLRLVHWPGGTTVSTIATNNDGQVVPDDRALKDVGLLEVRGAQPSWLRAWILAFDHPYWTTTAAGGAYSLAEVPPGQYRLVAWHERFGRIEQPVTVAGGQTTNVVLHLSAHPPNATADTTVADTVIPRAAKR